LRIFSEDVVNPCGRFDSLREIYGKRSLKVLQRRNEAISTDILDFTREFSSFRRQGAATGEQR